MKKSTIFWGVFFIGLGVLLLLRQVGIWDGYLDGFLHFWPVLLVIWGITLLKIGDMAKLVLTTVSALLLSLFTAGFISDGPCVHKHFHGDRYESNWCHFHYENDD